MSLWSFSPQGAFAGPGQRAVAPRPGEIIPSPRFQNAYRFGGKIGEGAYSVVYRCRDRWNNDLAAKVLKPTNTYEAVKAAARAEFERLRVLRHLRVTQVVDEFEYRDTFFLITEYCPSSVAELLPYFRSNSLAWVLRVGECVLEGLEYLHSQQYSHQDLHAGNVFGSIPTHLANRIHPSVVEFKIGDLGVAKLFYEIGETNTRAPWMLPPEVWDQGEFGPIDHRVDIYHLGLLLLDVAYGRELRFTTGDVLVGRPREMALRLPEPYAWMLERALRRHVPDRTPTAREFLRDLMQIPF
jgi:serine/threonine protein kinase